MIQVRNQTRDQILARHVETATTFLGRMVGLLGRKELPAGHGLWIQPANSVHTFFMRFSIDVVFASRENRVVRTYPSLPPFRLKPWIRGAYSLLELPTGTLASCPLQIGDQLVTEKAP